jgi:aminoglycoside phosphotransferase (APT) family kinase protein
MGAGSLVGAPSPQAEDVLSERAGIAEVRWALSGAAPRRALRGALQGLLEKGAVLRACRVQRAKLKPGRKLTVHYDAWVRSGGTDSKYAVVAIWNRGEGGIDLDAHVSALDAEAAARGLAAPFRGLFARLPGWNVSVLVSPLDPRLPQLTRLSDPVHVAAMLAGPLAQASDITWRVSAIRYRPGERHVLRYEPSAGPVAAVFAKLSRREADVARAFHVAVCLADRLDACGGGTRAVRPLAAVVEDGVILFPEVDGRPLSALLRGRQDGLIWYLRRAGRALRAFHAAPASLAGLAARDFAGEVEAVRRASEHICALLPRTGAVIVDALARARSVYDQLPPEPPTLVHGDFKADHLWVAGGGLTVLDFGSCAIGDPALDVGKFLADLRWWSALSGRGSASMRRAFLDAYGAEEVLRARVYEALFLVLFAAHRVPLYHPAWAERAASLVQRAWALLAELR